MKMGSKEVILSWAGHHQTMISVFEKLLERSSLVDCTLVAERKKLKAHKEVLLAFSPYFQLFFGEDQDINPTIILSGFTFQELSALIDYMYYGKVTVPEDSVERLIDAAQSLQIRGLGSRQGVNSKISIEHLNAYSGTVNASYVPHKRRKISNGEECTKLSVVGSSAKINHATQIEPQKLQKSRDGAEAEMSSHTGSLTSNVNPVLSSTNLSLPKHDLEVVPKREKDTEDVISCEIHDNSETILGLSAHINFGNNHTLCETVPLIRDSLILPSLPPSVLTVPVSPSSILEHIHISSSRNEQNSNMNMSSEDSLAHATGTDDVFVAHTTDTENVVLKTEPHDEYTEEVMLKETESFGGNMERDQLEKNYSRDPGAAHGVTGNQCGNQLACEPQLLHLSSAPSFQDMSLHERPQLTCPTVFNVLPGTSKTICNKMTCRKGRSQPDSITSEVHQNGAMPYKCSDCAYATSKPRNLVKHRRCHIAEKHYKCADCDYTCAWSNSLVIHRRRHTGEKPYKCTDCEYACVSANELVKHRRRHTGERPYKCTDCEYTCARISSLVKHQRRHTGEQLYKCPECDYACALRSSMVFHKCPHTKNKS